MPILLDETTRAEYLAQSVASTRASLVVNALTAPVVVEIFNGSNSLRASGVMASPWATASGATITVGEVNAAGINVTAGGAPTSLWYCQFRGANGRFVRGQFGVAGSGQDFTWSLPTFEAGSRGTIGTATFTAQGTNGLAPVNTLAPALSGSATVGSALSVSVGSWANTPTNPYTYQWQRSANGTSGWANIAGASLSSYSLTATDLSQYVRCAVTASNDFGGATAFSNASAQVTSAPSVATFTTLQLTSPTSGTLPWAFGQAFRQGDVPSGSSVVGDSVDFQATPTTYWPDGSVRHAIIAGRSSFVSAGTVTVSIGRGTAASGAALTIAELKSLIPASTSVAVGGTTMTLAGAFLDTPHRTVCTGPVMSNWIYRLPVAGSNHLVIWCDVRLYKGGAVELFPWVENAYLLVSGSASTVGTACSVTVGGASRFSQSINIAHHTRIPLVSGSTFSHWTSDPQITPRHDSTYLRATRMVPNYGWTNPSATTLNALQQTYTPNSLASINASMGVAGSSAAILNREDALYVSSGDARAWRAAMVFGLSGGSWSTHYRDNTTNEPLRFSDYPRASLNIQDTPVIPTGTGATNGSAVISHQPSYGYLMWLCTGRWWFLDEMLSWATWNYLQQSWQNRAQAEGRIRPDAGSNTDRGAAWGLRTLAQTFAALPDTHPCRASIKASWEANMAWYATLNTASNGGVGVNTLGVQSFFGNFAASVYSTANSSTNMYGAGWMQNMIHGVIGFAWDLGLPQTTTAQTHHQVVRDHGYTMPVAISGDGVGGNWDYRNFAVFGLNWGTIGGGYYPSWSGAYAIYKAGYSIGTLSGTALRQHSSASVLTGSDSTSPYFGQALTALVYATDHGKTGAAEGYLRVSGASNYASVASIIFNDDPSYGIVPRVPVGLPTWLSGKAVLEWAQVTGTMASAGIAPSPLPPGIIGVRAVTDAWGGGTVRQSSSHYIIHGGGHGDYAGNEVYTLDLRANAPVWNRSFGPTPNASITAQTNYYADGNPASVHSYYGLHFDAPRDRLLRMVGGQYITAGIGPNCDAWPWLAANWSPAGTVPNNPTSLYAGGGAAQHPTTGRIYNWNGPRLAVYDPASNTWVYQNNSASIQRWENAMVVDEVRNCVWSFGGYGASSSTVGRWDIGTNALTLPAVTGTGTAALTSFGAGAAWDSINDCAWVYTNAGTLYRFDPNTMTITTVAVTGTAPSSNATYGNTTGVWGRLCYVSALKGLVYTPSWNAPTFFIRTA